MKLIIDIPKYVYEVCLGHGDIVYQYIAKGTPYEERPTGEWVHNVNGTFECSRCGIKHSKANYCPDCGAKMYKGGEEE